MPPSRTGAEILVDGLLANGLATGFGVPGESYLAVLEAMRARNFDFVICRQEGGASMMADASAKLSGKPGLCFVTRGPGAANAMSGVHVAAQADGAPGRADLEAADDAGLADAAMDLEAPGGQLLGDDGGGALLLEADLRMGVEVVPPRGHLGMDVGDFVEDRHRGCSRMSAGGRGSRRD